MSRSFMPAALRYLDQVARSGSIQGASRELHVAASAVDRQVLGLEASLGVPLFERMPRGMRLTASGEVLVGLVRRWRADERNAVAELLRLQGVHQGEVNLFAMDSHATGLLPSMIERIAENHQLIALAVEIGSTDEAATALRSGQADLIIAFNLAPQRDQHILWSCDLPFGCVVAPEHPLAQSGDVSMQQVVAWPLALQSRSLPIRRFLEIQFSWLFAEPRNRIETNSLHLVKNLARSGRYVAFTSELDAASELADGTLRFVPVRDTAAIPQSVVIAIDAAKPVSSLVRLVADEAAIAIQASLAAARQMNTA